MPSVDIFTFISVYYKYGEYGSREFKTLREGLQDYLDDYISDDSHEGGIRRQQLEALPDEELLTEILEMGSERIKKQEGQGLVAVVKGPRDSKSCVYLEVYYKHGEWSVSQGWSTYLDDALEKLALEMKGEWEDMSEEEQEDLALERSQENVDNQVGWGVVLVVPGNLIAQGTPKF